MKLLDFFTLFHNWIADKDFIWWPFSFLRPETHVPITFRHTLLMTACFGGLAFIFFVTFAIMNNQFTAQYALLSFFSSFISFFIWFNAITRPLWNRRAYSLKK